jgi:uncharacterized protein (TIGR03437 family)
VRVPFFNNIFLIFSRSDFPGRLRRNCACPFDETNLPEVIAGFPEPQRWNGNLWYFDSWEDGSLANPRKFEIGDGISEPQVIKVRTALPFGIDPPALDFVTVQGTPPNPVSLTVFPSVQQRGTIWAGQPHAEWLTVTALEEGYDNFRKTATVTLTAAADAGGFRPGTYTTSVPVSFADPVRQVIDTVEIPVSLRILERPPTITGVADAASYRSQISPNQIITIFGTGLGPNEGQTALIPVVGEPPYVVAGTSVSINGIRIPLVYVQSNQVAAMVPGSVSTSLLSKERRQVTLTVSLGGTLSVSKTVPFAEYSPSLFTIDGSGRGNGAAINSDGSVNSPGNPAAKGSVIALFGTGFFGFRSRFHGGESCDNGFIAPFSSQGADSPLEATVGGQRVQILYAGWAPGQLCGLQQINVLLPENSPSGNAVPVELSLLRNGQGSVYDYEWFTTQRGVTIAIR